MKNCCFFFYEQFQNQIEKESELVAEIANLKKLLLEKDKIIKSKDAEIDYFKKKANNFLKKHVEYINKNGFRVIEKPEKKQ